MMALVTQILLVLTILAFSASQKKDDSSTKIFPGSGSLAGIHASISSGALGQTHGSRPFGGGNVGGFGQGGRPGGFGQGGRPHKPFGGGVSGGVGHGGGIPGGFGHGGGISGGLDHGGGIPGGFGHGGGISGGLDHGGGFPGGISHGGRPQGGIGGIPGGIGHGVGGGFPGFPHGGGTSSNCRYWCRNSANKFYCCESDDQPPGPVGEKQGYCPPVRPSCPGTKFGPPKTCSNDYSCPGIEKCCEDICLGLVVCKAPDNFLGPSGGHHSPGGGGFHGHGAGGGFGHGSGAFPRKKPEK